MTMNFTSFLKILLVVFVASVALDKSIAHPTKRHDELSKSVVGAIREVMQALKGGATANDLRHLFDGILVIVDGILADANATVENAKVHTFLDTLKSKINVENMNGLPTKSFAVLSELADLLETKLGTTDKEDLYKILETIKVVVAELLENMEVLGDDVIYTFKSKPTPVAGQGIDTVRRARGQRPLNRTRRCWLWCHKHTQIITYQGVNNGQINQG